MMQSIQSSLRRVPFQHLTSLLFLLATSALLATGLGEMVRGAQLSAFVPVGITGALIGWMLGTRRLNGWLTWGVMVLGGMGLLWVSTAQFDGPLLRLVNSIPTLLAQLTPSDPKIVPDFSILPNTWLDLVNQSTGLRLRIWYWVSALQNGENRYDPVIYVLAWSFLLWLTAIWQGRFLRREQVLTASIPSLLLLAELDYITGADLAPLWSMLAITLLLMGLTHFRLIFTSWAQRGIDYAEIIFDTTIAFILTATLFLGALAWTLPAFSLQDMLDRIREINAERIAQDGPTVAERLGLQTAVPAQSAANGGIKEYATLPDLHNIGPGPELSRDLVMSIRTGEIPPGQSFEPARQAPYHRWRSNTMDRYTGLGWANSPVIKTQYAADETVFPKVPAQYRILHQSIRAVSVQLDQRVYWDGILQSVDHPFSAGWRTKPQTNLPENANPFADADLLGAFASSVKDYRVTSLLMVVDEEHLRAASVRYPDGVRRRYLALPNGIPERVFALARQVTATAPTAYDQARALETYLRKTYPYTLNIPAPPGGRDVVDYFLFDLKKGFCDYYATAMVVMARSLGLPARIVFGYASGTYDQIQGEYNVVKADAHAWVEIYFPKLGWVEFDPTSNRPEIDRLPEPDSADNQSNSIDQLDTAEKIAAWWQNFMSTVLRWSLPTLAGLAVLIVLWQLGEFLLLNRLPAIRAIQMIYRGLYRAGRPFVGRATAGETTVEFDAKLYSQIERLAKKRILQKPLSYATYYLDMLTRLYLRAMYTTHPPEKTEIRAAVQAWQTLRWQLLLAALALALEPILAKRLRLKNKSEVGKSVNR